MPPAAAAPAKKQTTPAEPEAPKVAPGTIPPPNRILSLPEIVQKPYFEVFPDLAPKPAENAPGVFINDDGSIYQPRERIGGQFAALLVEIENKYTRRGRRILVPNKTLPDEYGVNKATEKVTARTEVLFDFEDECLAALESFGHKDKRDPAARMAAKGYGDRYDDMATSAGHGQD